MSEIPNPTNSFQQPHVEMLLKSFSQWTGHDLVTPDSDPVTTAQKLFEAPFVVVSHNTELDPIFNYGNKTALELFELSWDEFTSLPSRKSAEPINREQRAAILKQVEDKGYSDNYSGIRISSSGRRFEIKNATLWNLVDATGHYQGQAACFDSWEFI